MRRSDFHYELPRELIAQEPTPERSASRLLALDGTSGEWRDLRFLDLRANRLADLPPSLGALPRLEKLDLRWNRLSSRPPWLAGLAARGCVVYK